MFDTDAPSRRSLKAVVDEVIARRVRGEECSDDDVVRTHPQLMPQLEHELRKVRRVEEARLAAVRGTASAGDEIAPTSHSASPTFHHAVQIEGYEILRPINHGGQAVIYLARQIATGSEVALKVLRMGALADERQRVRFEREAELLGSIDHPNIVTVLDHGTTRDGQLYLVMNY